jgi:hypothetical protein
MRRSKNFPSALIIELDSGRIETMQKKQQNSFEFGGRERYETQADRNRSELSRLGGHRKIVLAV